MLRLLSNLGDSEDLTGATSALVAAVDVVEHADADPVAAAAIRFAAEYMDRSRSFDLWQAHVRIAEEAYRSAVAGREAGR